MPFYVHAVTKGTMTPLLNADAFNDLDKAIEKACEMLRGEGFASANIVDHNSAVILDAAAVRARCGVKMPRSN